MPRQCECVEQHQLTEYSLGRLSEDAAEHIEQHLRQCADCLNALRSPRKADALVEALRAQRCEPADSSQVEGLVERLKKLRGDRALGHDSTAALDEHTSGNALRPPSAEATQEGLDFLGPPLVEGDVGQLGGYRILRVLGQGGMGIVFLGQDPKLLRTVAIKCVRPALVASRSARQRFLREAQAMAAIKHAHVAAIYQVGEDRGIPFLAMEFLEGESLDARMGREGKLSLAEAVRVAHEMAEGLDAAHQRGLLHRDVKPSNVWLEGAPGASPTGGRVKILDFGLAREAGAAQLTLEGALLGTPAYLAPEQAQGEALDVRCDLFSLGCVLFRMLTGQPAFKGRDVMSTLLAVCSDEVEPVRKFSPEVPPALADLVKRLLAKKPQARPESAQAVAEQLKAVEEELKRPSAAPTAKPRKRWPLLVGVVALLAALGASGAWLGTVILREPTPDGKGHLVVETDDPKVKVTVRKDGVLLIDPTTNREIELKIGNYEIELAEAKEGLRLTTTRFTIERDGKTRVKVYIDQAPVGVKAGPSPLDALKREDIPAQWLAAAGGGDAKKAPAQLVAVLSPGDSKRDYAGHLGFLPDGRTLIAIHGGRTNSRPFLELRDAVTGQEKLSLSLSRNYWKPFTANGTFLVNRTESNSVGQWQLPSGKELRSVTVEDKLTDFGVLLSPDGRKFACLVAGKGIRLRDTITGKEVGLIEEEFRRGAPAFSPRADTIAVPLPDRKGVGVWDTGTSKQLKVLAKDEPEITALAFSPDGAVLAGGGATLNVWETSTWRLRRQGEGVMHVSLCFTPDGERLAAVGSAPGNPKVGVVRVWNLETGTVELSLSLLSGRCFSCAFSPDGRHLAVGSIDGSISILRLAGRSTASSAQ